MPPPAAAPGSPGCDGAAAGRAADSVPVGDRSDRAGHPAMRPRPTGRRQDRPIGGRHLPGAPAMGPRPGQTADSLIRATCAEVADPLRWGRDRAGHRQTHRGHAITGPRSPCDGAAARPATDSPCRAARSDGTTASCDGATAGQAAERSRVSPALCPAARLRWGRGQAGRGLPDLPGQLGVALVPAMGPRPERLRTGSTSPAESRPTRSCDGAAAEHTTDRAQCGSTAIFCSCLRWGHSRTGRGGAGKAFSGNRTGPLRWDRSRAGHGQSG